jgi:hypothetical protein
MLDRFVLVPVVALAAIGAPGAIAAADDPCGTTRPWLGIVFEGGAFDAELRGAVLADLARGLDARGADVCEADEAAGTRVELALAGGLLSATLDTGGARSAAEVDLHGIPLDGWSLAISAAVDGLLRAQWVEIVLRRPVVEAPEVVQPVASRVIAAPIRPAARPPPASDERSAHEIAWVASTDVWTGGAVLFGSDVRYGLRPLEVLGLTVGLGSRLAWPTESQLGTIDGFAASLELGAALRFTSDGATFTAELGAYGRLLVVRFTGDADGAAAESTEWSVAPSVGVVVRAGVRLAGPIVLVIEPAIELPLRAIEVAAGDEVVLALDGVAVRGSLGLVWEFR